MLKVSIARYISIYIEISMAKVLFTSSLFVYCYIYLLKSFLFARYVRYQ